MFLIIKLYKCLDINIDLINEKLTTSRKTKYQNYLIIPLSFLGICILYLITSYNPITKFEIDTNVFTSEEINFENPTYSDPEYCASLSEIGKEFDEKYGINTAKFLNTEENEGIKLYL